MKMYKKLIYGVLLFLTIASCSESSEQEDEYANWKERNDVFFQGIFFKADSAINAGSNNWKIIRNWSLQEQFGVQKENNIVVHVLENSTNTSVPIYTDSVVVDIQGMLMPTDNEERRTVFYTTFSGKDRNVSSDLRLTISAKGTLQKQEIDGLSTALQKMHIGDRWMVYVPYNLALKNQSSVSPFVPAYSTMIFDITLLGIKHT